MKIVPLTKSLPRLRAAALVVALVAGFGAQASALHEPVVPRSYAGPSLALVVAAKQIPEKVDLNSATLDDLVELPGIGESRASAILALRDERGGFRTVEELLEVRGIGPKALEKLRPFLKLGKVMTP